MKKTAIIEQEEWYKFLIEQGKALICETIFNSRWALVEGYWKLGELVREDKNFVKFAKTSHTSLQDLAKNLGISERTLYYSLQAYDKFPDLDKIPDGKNISWNKLITKYLLELKKEEHICDFKEIQELKCKICGKKKC